LEGAPPYPILWRNGDGTCNPKWAEAPLPEDPELTPDAAVFPDELRQNRFFRRQGKSGPDEQRGDFASLKELVTELGERSDEQGFYYPVRDILIKTHQYAIARFDVDGFRIDTLKHVEREFARVFGNAMREFALSIGKKNFFTFGEVADNDEKIARYTGRFASDPDDLIGVDSALDFPLFGTLVAVVKGSQPPSDLARLYEFRKQLHRGQVEDRQVLISSHAEASRFFVTFLDNHDQHHRFRYSAPPNPNQFDSQVSMGVGCLFALQGIPVIYYGTEQGLHGMGDIDQFVREALWGKPDAFATNNPFYRAVQDIAQVWATQPALRYGRLYFRQVAGEDGKSFALWAAKPGIIAFSRLLNELEVVVVANAFTDAPFTFFVLVDFGINSVGSQFDLLYSNQANAAAPGPVQQLEADIFDLSGNKSHGPVRAMKVTLQPMEIQILGQKA
jgi:glycosidase